MDDSMKHDAQRMVACYHRVRADDDFETAAHMLWKVVEHAQNAHPDVPRRLYVDIDGHRVNGVLDADMQELLEFIPTMLGDYLTEFEVRNMLVRNPHQRPGPLPPLSIQRDPDA